MAGRLDKAALMALLALVNATETLSAKAELDRLASSVPSSSLQQLDGYRMIETYVDGSGVAETPFAVLLRVKPDDSDARADAAGELMGLADALEAKSQARDLPEGWRSLVGVSTPTVIERNENGSEIWRASFVLVSEVSAPALA